MLKIGKFLRNFDVNYKIQKGDWRGENLLQITQEFNIEVFRHIYWFPNAFVKSLNLFFVKVGKMLNFTPIFTYF